MDEYSGAAAGYGWMGAYLKRRFGNGSAKITTSKEAFRNALSPEQIPPSSPPRPSVCVDAIADNPTVSCITNATTAIIELNAGRASVLSFEHEQQLVPYGFGLVTAIASADLAYRAADDQHAYSPAERTIATELFREAQIHTPASGDIFNSDCIDPNVEGGSVVGTTGRPCGGPGPQGPAVVYKPNMFPLLDFYTSRGFTIPASGPYQFNIADPSLFPTTSDFFGAGRQALYLDQAYNWVRSTPRFHPYDLNEPTGFFDGISPSGVASGWVCDRDVPDRSTMVSFNIDTPFGPSITTQRASVPAEQDVLTLCGATGYNLHRFQVQLPAYTQGRAIYGFAFDYTWVGFYQMGSHTW